MYRENNKGPRTVPCGTPDKTGAQSDFTPFTTTRCCLKQRKESIHFNVLPPIPYLNNLIIYERDHSRVNGTTHFWTKPVDYQFTNGGPIHIWRSSHTRRYRLHVEDHGQPIPTCERDLYVWSGLPCVNGTCICERVLYLWRTLQPWTRHPRVNGTRCLLVNGFSTNVLNSTDDSYTC